MYTLKTMRQENEIWSPFALVEERTKSLEFDKFIHVPVLVYFDGDECNPNPSRFALLVYIDGDSKWNIVVVERDFDLKMFIEFDESDAMISGPGYPALQTDEGRIIMETIHLVARWNHYDVAPLAG